jgi:L-ascorbate metabolism protein UlaG (beta-lactamase superfamily)
MTTVAGVYLLGVAAALVFTDARGLARLALALLWPIGPLAFVVTVSVLLLASLVAFPIIGAIVLASALAAAAFAQAPAQPSRDARPPLEARFIGNMAYAISDGKTTLFTDFPYQSGYSVYMEYDGAQIRSSTPRTLSLITHRHGDHWDRGLFQKTNWQVMGPLDAVGDVPVSRVVRALPVAPSRSTTTFADLTIDAIPTPHADIGHYSYVVTWHDRRLYFTGDTDDATALLAATSLDVAFVSPWLFQRAKKSGRQIDARRIVIYHQTADETVPGCSGICSVPTQGQALQIE